MKSRNMQNIILILCAICILHVLAFRDTSPFLLLSSSTPSKSVSDSIEQFSQDQLKSRTQVLDITEQFLSNCPSRTYFILVQPEVSVVDLSNNASLARQIWNKLNIDTRISIRETVGLQLTDGDVLLRYLETRCGGIKTVAWTPGIDLEQKAPYGSLVVLKKFPEKIPESEISLHTDLLAGITERFKYTVILLTTPHKPSETKLPSTYMSTDEPLHSDLKREIVARAHKISVDADLRPLFEKYQFFNPGLFIGILVTILLLAILGVGIRAISSLEVSYGAFEKELGTIVQKK